MLDESNEGAQLVKNKVFYLLFISGILACLFKNYIKRKRAKKNQLKPDALFPLAPCLEARKEMRNRLRFRNDAAPFLFLSLSYFLFTFLSNIGLYILENAWSGRHVKSNSILAF